MFYFKSLIVIFILFISSFSQASELNFPRPEKFSIGIEGFLGASYRVELAKKENTVLYLWNPRTFTSWNGTQKQEITIPEERWKKLWYEFEELKIWEWKEKYIDDTIADGTVWDVTIVWNKKNIKSRGSNAYPGKKDFKIFSLVIESFLGSKTFR